METLTPNSPPSPTWAGVNKATVVRHYETLENTQTDTHAHTHLHGSVGLDHTTSSAELLISGSSPAMYWIR